MSSFEKSVKKLAVLLYYGAGVAIVFMMLITTIDVLLRLAVTIYASTDWAFLEPFKPIAGTYELVCYMGALAAAFAMAHTSVEGGHVAVSLVTRLLPKKLQAVLKVVVESLGIVFFAMIAWRCIVYALKMQQTGEVSMTLQLPVYPFVYGVSFGAFAVCLVLLTSIFSTPKREGADQ
jgi:TRAP-type C4-dicarboxylate transport system permease small subunit